MPTFKQPAIYITEQACVQMVEEVLSHPKIETAWGIVGIAMDDGSAIVLGVIEPTAEDITRQYAHAQLGGDGQVEALRWLHTNDAFYKRFFKKETVGRLAYLYKGHSHHSLAFSEYSSTDIASIVSAVKDDGLKIAIGPLALIHQPDTRSVTKTFKMPGTLLVDRKSRVALRFYYYSEEMMKLGMTAPILITPKQIQPSAAPIMPPMGWNFAHEHDFYEQLRHLRNFGANVNVTYQEKQDGPPFEIVFHIQRKDWKGILEIVTTWDYPAVPPKITVLNLSGREALHREDFLATTSLLEGALWNPGDDFIDIVFRLMARGEL